VTLGTGKDGSGVTVSGSFTDAGKLDTHTVLIDWGDGTSSVGTVVEASGAGTLSGSHVYKAGGIYAVSVKVSDGQATATAGTNAIVCGVSVRNGVLQIVGTAGDDHVTVNKVGDVLKIKADFLSAAQQISAVGLTQIVVALGAGNNTFATIGNVKTPVVYDLTGPGLVMVGVVSSSGASVSVKSSLTTLPSNAVLLNTLVELVLSVLRA
jgi:hypothetical protein